MRPTWFRRLGPITGTGIGYPEGSIDLEVHHGK